ncbi:MAG: hypothetical protein QOK29_3240 [Rhodospirillaceae bacterium]|jgi:DNA-binding transcriptional MocR family regulator|nr:hypothetical protein [Rhodospirillaceae bacterium]
MTEWLPEDLPREGRRYLAITQALERDIRSGRLRPGDQLPTHRDLAFKLGVSVSTASRAYTEAAARRLIVSEVGRGSFVLPSPYSDQVRQVFDQKNTGGTDLGYNCAIDSPHVASALSASLAEISSGNRLPRLIAYERPYVGLLEHRQAAVAWIEMLGLRAHPDQIVMVAGAQHAMATIFASVTKPGDTILTEELTDPGLTFLCAGHHLKLRGVPMDKDGIIPSAFDAACRAGEAKALFCMPNHQSPTLAVMPTSRRQEIASIAERHDLIIVENDTYGAFQDPPLPALSTYAPERSFYLTSLSKILAPGLRIGFVVAPPGRAIDLVRGLGATSWMASPITAEIASHWIRTGTAARLAALQRKELIRRHDLLKKSLGGFEYNELPSSLHVWMPLPPNWRADALTRQAKARGVIIVPSEVFVIGHNPAPQAVRISLGAVGRPDLKNALETLSDVLHGQAEANLMIL